MSSVVKVSETELGRVGDSRDGDDWDDERSSLREKEGLTYGTNDQREKVIEMKERK